MKHPLLESVEKPFLRSKPLPNFRAGDTVCVWVKIQEGVEKDGTPKFRLQPFEGVVIRRKKGVTNATFLVRKIAAGSIGVERNFYVHSPLISHVEIKVRGRVRRARIYYIRKLRGKSARVAAAQNQNLD